MSGIVQKRLALLFVAMLFILALVPAYYPFEDETLRKDCPFCNAYDQLFTATSTNYGLCHDFRPIEASVSPATPCDLPNPLPSATESRAPPA
jgi:hypothetical protein